MRPPLEIRNLAPALAAGDEAKSDHAQQQINLKNRRAGREIQPPKAISKKFSCVFATYVHHENGRVERHGLYRSASNAAFAAEVLDREFQTEAAPWPAP